MMKICSGVWGRIMSEACVCRHLLISLLATVSLTPTLFAQEETAKSPYFTTDLEAALEAAAIDGKPVICEVYTPG